MRAVLPRFSAKVWGVSPRPSVFKVMSLEQNRGKFRANKMVVELRAEIRQGSALGYKG